MRFKFESHWAENSMCPAKSQEVIGKTEARFSGTYRWSPGASWDVKMGRKVVAGQAREKQVVGASHQSLSLTEPRGGAAWNGATVECQG